MAEERVYFKQDDIIISSTSFVFGKKTYAANNVTSVSWRKSTGKKFFGFLMMIAGAFLLLATITHFGTNTGPSPIGIKLYYSAGYMIRYYFSLGFGITAIILGLLVLILRKEKYFLILTSSGTKQKPLVHRDKDLLIQIATAINDAIVQNHQK
jgi:hypothetical protein